MFKKFFNENFSYSFKTDNKLIRKIKLSSLLIVCILLSVILTIHYFLIMHAQINKLVINNQAALVDVITDEVIIGSMYKENSKTTEEATSVQNSESTAQDHIISTSSSVNLSVNRNILALNKEDQNKVKISIIIAGLGINEKLTNEVLEIKNHLVLGLSPYTANLDDWIIRAKELGFEVLLHMPLQPNDTSSKDLGPLTLLKDLSEKNIVRLDKLINLSGKNVGFYTQSDEVISDSKQDMMQILNVLQSRDSLYVFANDKNAPLTQDSCNKLQLQCFCATNLVHEESSEDAVLNELNKRISDSSISNHLIYIDANGLNISAIKRWLAVLDYNKYVIVPISNLIPEKN